MQSGTTIFINSHDLKQPLNVIRLVSDNIKFRIMPQLGSEDLEYLAVKLSRIDDQIEKIMSMVDQAAQDNASGAGDN